MESDPIIPYSIFFHFHSLHGQLFYFPTAQATEHDYSCLFAVGCVYSSSHYRAITLTSVWPHFCCTDWQFSSAIITWSNWMPDSISSTLTISKYPRESLTVDAEAKSKRKKTNEKLICRDTMWPFTTIYKTYFPTLTLRAGFPYETHLLSTIKQ